MRYSDRHQRARQVARAEAHGGSFTPACACGCGEPVPFSGTGHAGQFKQYVNRAHANWCRDYVGMCRISNAARIQGDIPISQFRAAVRKLKAAKGLTIPQLSIAGGRSSGWLNQYLYTDKYRHIRRSTVEDFLRRVGGLPRTARPADERAARLAQQRWQSIDRKAA